jgi:hypothetical protein
VPTVVHEKSSPPDLTGEEETKVLNEGLVHADSRTKIKSEMVRQIHKLGATTPEQWEGAVFEAFTGGRREDIDWDVEDNKAGYFLWVKTFDELIGELEEDGYVTVATEGDGKILRPVDTDEPIDYSSFVYPEKS